jgi:hypothetical protein
MDRQAALLFDGQKRQLFHQRGGEQPATAARRLSFRIIDPDTLDAAARRVLFKHIAG